MSKVIFNYHPITKEYLDEVEAKRSPADIEEVYLIPAYATDIKPNLQEGKITKFVDGAWVYENIPTPPIPAKPTLEEEIAALKEKLLFPRKSYLYSTDWYTNREMDEPNSYPAEVKNRRILARQEINLINSYQTLGELSQIEVNFS